MKQRLKKRWEDHTIIGIGRREARAAFYIFRGSGAVSGRIYECRH